MNNFNPQTLIFSLKISLLLVKIILKWAQVLDTLYWLFCYRTFSVHEDKLIKSGTFVLDIKFSMIQKLRPLNNQYVSVIDS